MPRPRQWEGPIRLGHAYLGPVVVPTLIVLQSVFMRLRLWVPSARSLTRAPTSTLITFHDTGKQMSTIRWLLTVEGTSKEELWSFFTRPQLAIEGPQFSLTVLDRNQGNFTAVKLAAEVSIIGDRYNRRVMKRQCWIGSVGVWGIIDWSKVENEGKELPVGVISDLISLD